MLGFVNVVSLFEPTLHLNLAIPFRRPHHPNDDDDYVYYDYDVYDDYYERK